MKSVSAKLIMFSLLFFFVGTTSARDVPVVTNLTDLENIVNSTWISNSINRLMPPAKDCVYNNSLGAIAYNDGFDTNFIAALTPVVLYNGTNEFVMYPVEVIETNNSSGRIRNYYSAISTNPAILHSNEVSIVNYPVSWIENIYGEPPVYLSGSAIQNWYDECDPMRQHVLCDLLPIVSVPDYLTMLTNSIGYYTEGTNTNSVLSLYSNVIAVVQCSINAEDAELYLHAPDDISILDVYKSTNLLEQYSWVLNATLEHNLDPLRYVANFDALGMYYSLGNGVLDSDGDGLLDARELTLFGTDPDSADSDNDGLSDGEEMLLYRLNPLNSDTDGDGLSDGYEHDYSIIKAWGDNRDEQCNIPDTLTNAIAIAAGGDWYSGHSLALLIDGTVKAWGGDLYGQCDVPENLANVTAISAGGYHSLALLQDGTVQAWGDNRHEQSNVPTNLTNVISISAGGNWETGYSLALLSDGTVQGWGNNWYGQCTGAELFTNVIAISAGAYHSLALLPDGTVRAWGANSSDQCTVPSNLTNVVAISAGGFHSLAMLSDGTVRGWGYNGDGQCVAPSNLVDVIAISAGAEHSLALLSDGTIKVWGNNLKSQSFVPENIMNVAAISTGGDHNIVLINLTLNPLSSDTDSDGLPDRWEVENGLDPSDSTGDNGAYGDPDKDSLTNLEELQVGTNPTNFDTDGDMLSDSWELKYGLNPLVFNNVLTEDTDGDGLFLLDEYRYVTNPTNRDTDADGVWDGDEVPHSDGSNPNDGSDFGSSTNCVTMELTVGDPSTSNSERWQFNVFDGDKPIIRHVDENFGTPGSKEYSLVKGKKYTYKIKWIASNFDVPDYDWRAFINDELVSGFYNGLYSTGGFIVEDPDNLLTYITHGNEIDITEGKEGRIIVPKVDLDGDFDHDGDVDDDDLGDPEEHTAPGLLVLLNEDDLVKIHLDLLPDAVDSGLVTFAATHTPDAGDIKIWESSTKGGTPVVDTTTTGTDWNKEWTLSSSFKFGDIPEDLYVEGFNASSGGQINLVLRYQNPVGTTICEDNILITVIVPELDVGETARPANCIGWNDPWTVDNAVNKILVWNTDASANKTEYDLLKYSDMPDVFYRITQREQWNSGYPIEDVLTLDQLTKNPVHDSNNQSYDFKVWYGPSGVERDKVGPYEVYAVSHSDYIAARNVVLVAVGLLRHWAEDCYYHFLNGGDWPSTSLYPPDSTSGTITFLADQPPENVPYADLTHKFGATLVMEDPMVFGGRRFPRSMATVPVYHWDDQSVGKLLFLPDSRVQAVVKAFINKIEYAELRARYLISPPSGSGRAVQWEFSMADHHRLYWTDDTSISLTGGDDSLLGLINEKLGLGDLWVVGSDPANGLYGGSGHITLIVEELLPSEDLKIHTGPIIDMTAQDLMDFNYWNDGIGPAPAASIQCAFGRPGIPAGVGKVVMLEFDVKGTVENIGDIVLPKPE